MKILSEPSFKSLNNQTLQRKHFLQNSSLPHDTLELSFKSKKPLPVISAKPKPVTEPNTAIFRAIHNNDLTAVTAAINAGGDVASLSDMGITTLGYAESPEMVDHLLTKGADIEQPDENGYTPLLYAVEQLKPDVLERLIHHGANIHATSNGSPSLGVIELMGCLFRDILDKHAVLEAPELRAEFMMKAQLEEKDMPRFEERFKERLENYRKVAEILERNDITLEE